jgi:translation initiation factor eIF-2B subunit delta
LIPSFHFDSQKKNYLLETIDTYIRDQIEKAAQAISNSVQNKISNGDVILTYGCSSLIKLILKEANDKNDRFSVIVVDSRPSHEGQAMIKRLVKEGIACKCVEISALGFIMPEVTKVILGAHALLANGCVMGRVGTAQIALVAKSYNVPVLVCCETHKFSERVQTDAFVHNEIANPDDIMLSSYQAGDAATMADWRSMAHLTPLNIRYDITPPELVTAVITEIAILPCTSVPVILRIKPSEIGY